MEKEVGVRATQVIKCTNSGSFNSDTSRKLGQAQANDPDIGPVYRFIESGTEKPNWSTVSNLSSDSKRLRLHIHEGILFRKWESTNGQKCWDQLILPMQYRDSVLEQLHDSVTGGGGGGGGGTLDFTELWSKFSESEELKQFLIKYAGQFSKNDFDIGFCDIIEHEIVTSDVPPIKQNPRRIGPEQRFAADKIVEDLLEKGLIKHSKSPWASPIVMVKKKDNTYRMCIDYREVNKCSTLRCLPITNCKSMHFTTFSGPLILQY